MWAENAAVFSRVGEIGPCRESGPHFWSSQSTNSTVTKQSTDLTQLQGTDRTCSRPGDVGWLALEFLSPNAVHFHDMDRKTTTERPCGIWIRHSPLTCRPMKQTLVNGGFSTRRKKAWTGSATDVVTSTASQLSREPRVVNAVSQRSRFIAYANGQRGQEGWWLHSGVSRRLGGDREKSCVESWKSSLLRKRWKRRRLTVPDFRLCFDRLVLEATDDVDGYLKLNI